MECQILTYNTHGLPWSTDTSKPICQWLKTRSPGILCLQEVFLETNRKYYKEQLERAGYTVVLPHDGIPGILGSGLLTAVLEKDYVVENHCFQTFKDYHNVEHFSNKGFLIVWLWHRDTKCRLLLVNTHTQSSTFVSVLFGNAIIHKIRRAQLQQIIEACTERPGPALIVGDLNCEVSPHPYLRFLQLNPALKKHTFPSTGEDLDHIGWLPLQWTERQWTERQWTERPQGPALKKKVGCSLCDIDKQGPQMTACEIPTVPWSDHAPLLATVWVPFF